MRNLFVGEFKDYSLLDNKQILRKVIRENLIIKSELKEEFNQFIINNFLKYNLGVHIRYSDLKVPLDKIYALVEKKRKKNIGLFLATDSLDIVQDFQQKFSPIIMADKWFSPSGIRLHQNPHECDNLLQNGIEALKDIYLLSQCQELIFSSQSSFGYLSSIFKENISTNYDIQLPQKSLFSKLKTVIGGR